MTTSVSLARMFWNTGQEKINPIKDSPLRGRHSLGGGGVATSYLANKFGNQHEIDNNWSVMGVGEGTQISFKIV